jgi:hypothetical protein
MKQSEESFLNMVHSVLDNLKKNKSFLVKEPVIEKQVNAIERDFNQILGNLNINSRLEPVRYPQPKNEELHTIIQATIKISRRMYIYARSKNDEVILNLATIFENALDHGSEKEIILCCNTILSRAEWMHYFLTPYNINEKQLTPIRQLIDAYNEQHFAHSKVKVIGRHEMHNLSDQINELKGKLELLDELVDGLIKRKRFIAHYHAFRIAVHYRNDSITEIKADPNYTNPSKV